MIHIKFDPEKYPDLLTPEQRKWFDDWKARAQAATDRAILAWEAWRLIRKNPDSLTDAQKAWLEEWKKSPEAKRLKLSKDGTFDKFDYAFETDIWGEMKTWLLENIFSHKCAYCEKEQLDEMSHAEHFRPKGSVRQLKGKNFIKASIKDDNEQETTHPGYFWLAYHWQNLLPSCFFCNTGKGKKDKFPVLNDYASVMRQLAGEVCDQLEQRIIKSQQFDETYYLQPRDLDLIEGRGLLHPFFDDPQKYLSFDEFGQAFVVECGEEDRKIADYSIKTYNLNRDTLVKQRYHAQLEANNEFDGFIVHYKRKYGFDPKDAKAVKEAAGKDALEKYNKREQEYSAAILAGLRQHDPEAFS
jgi:hypothetical protein